MKRLTVLFITCLMVIGCEKDIASYMENYYTDSMGLQDVSLDSVNVFSTKVENYVIKFPEEKANPLYPKIRNNIINASIRITIECDTTWDGETHINF